MNKEIEKVEIDIKEINEKEANMGVSYNIIIEEIEKTKQNQRLIDSCEKYWKKRIEQIKQKLKEELTAFTFPNRRNELKREIDKIFEEKKNEK